MSTRWLALLLLVGCSSSHEEPRWYLARVDLAASDDPTVHLAHGFGVQVVEARGDRVLTSEGHWFPRASLQRVTPSPSVPTRAPATVDVPAGVTTERWVDVDLAAQRLTAYEGSKPVRAFAISTGIGVDGAPFSTPRGTHRIYAKLRSTSMASEPKDPHPYRFEAVPSVQYFDREIALHGAYWHRKFGQRVSHGCVNLAPADAAWLFDFTLPHLLPSERDSGKLGAVVRVH